MTVSVRTAAAVALLLLLGAGSAATGEDDLPAPTQALLLFRVLGYDRNLAQRAGSAVTIAVAWQVGDEGPRDAAVDALRDLASRYRIAGLPVHVVPVRFEEGAFGRRLEGAEAQAVLVVGGLGAEAPRLVATFRALHLLSAASSRAAAEAGLTVALFRRGDRAAVAVNLPSARAAGASLDSTLFLVAEALGAPGEAQPGPSR